MNLTPGTRVALGGTFTGEPFACKYTGRTERLEARCGLVNWTDGSPHGGEVPVRSVTESERCSRMLLWTCGEYLSPNPLDRLDCTGPGKAKEHTSSSSHHVGTDFRLRYRLSTRRNYVCGRSACNISERKRLKQKELGKKQ